MTERARRVCKTLHGWMPHHVYGRVERIRVPGIEVRWVRCVDCGKRKFVR